VDGVQFNSRKDELERISRSLNERLRGVCDYMTDADFAVMIRSMAEVQWRSEHRPPDTLIAEMMRFKRGSSLG
jgi:hypothetical protein